MNFRGDTVTVYTETQDQIREIVVWVGNMWRCVDELMCNYFLFSHLRVDDSNHCADNEYSFIVSVPTTFNHNKQFEAMMIKAALQYQCQTY